MKVGYGRVAARGQDMERQRLALAQAGCERVVFETTSDARRGRPHLEDLLKTLSVGNVLAVWRLDRLALSLGQCAATLGRLQILGVTLEVVEVGLAAGAGPDCPLRQGMAAILAFDADLARERRQVSLLNGAGRAGRRPALGAAEIRRAKTLLSDPTLTVADVARSLGVQPSTLYRHIPGGRSALVEMAA